jgi:hypothetical protein
MLLSHLARSDDTVMSPEDAPDRTKLIEADQTAADALWGYRDSHGQFTDGLVQRVRGIEIKQNISLGLVALSFGKTCLPDILNGVMPFLKTAIAWFH